MKRVLIVDDAAFMRLTIKTILESNGYQVAGEAENGQVAVQKYKELNPDLVVMDITMPEMDGLEALQEIKKINKEAKVLMVSAMGQETFIRRAIAHGAKNFIVKPFPKETFLKAIQGM